MPLRIIVAFEKIAVVDAVRVFVEKHKNFGGLRNLRDFKKLHVIGIVNVETVGGKVAGVTDHRVHRITADAPVPADGALGGADDVVGGTTVNGRHPTDKRAKTRPGEGGGVGV